MTGTIYFFMTLYRVSWDLMKGEKGFILKQEECVMEKFHYETREMDDGEMGGVVYFL